MELGIAGLSGAELIGTGGFAVVYKAEQPAFRRTVAVKLLTVGRLDEATSHRFERECQLMGSLSEHPSIVTMFDAGFTAEGRPYLLMAYMPGGSLEDRVAASGPLSWREAVPICVRMAGALEVAHRRDVVHRDVKPANILLSSFGEPQLTDFGIARIAGGPETRSGIITASMAHAAPEVIDGDRPGVVADVYSLGSTLFALLAGEPAFTKNTDESLFPLLIRIRTDPVPDLRTRGIPDEVCAAMEAAMAKDPAARPQSALEFGELLRAAERAAGLAPTSMLLGFDAAPVADPAVAETVAVVATPSNGEDLPHPAASGPVPSPAAASSRTVAAAAPLPSAVDAPVPRRPPAWLLAALAAVIVVALIGGAVALLRGDGGTSGGGGTDDIGNGAAGPARQLVPGTVVEGRLGEGETHAYTFDGPEGIVAAVEMRVPGPDADPFVAVFDSAGGLIAADDDLGGGVAGLDALSLFVMPIHGAYVVEASNRTGEPTDYVIAVHFEAVTLLHPPVVTGEALEFSESDRDLYVFTARQGDVFEVLMASEQPGLDPFLAVYGPAERLVEDDDSGGGIEGLDARVVFTAPSDGSYRIVAGHGDQTGGPYRLEVNPG